LGTDLDSKYRTLQAIFAVDCNTAPFGSSILGDNVIVTVEISGFLGVFLSQDSDTSKTSGLAECAKAFSKTNLGSRLLMLTCMKPRHKSTNESTWGVGEELGTAGPGLTSTSPEEQRRSRIRVWLNAILTGRLARSEQRV
jgi:hypothetical protein